MAFEVYFRAVTGQPLAQIFLSPGSADAAIVSILMQSLPTTQPAPGVYKAAFSPGAGQALDWQQVAKEGQTVALVYATKDSKGQIELADVHMDPRPTTIDASLAEALSQAAEVQLAQLPVGKAAWLFVAL